MCDFERLKGPVLSWKLTPKPLGEGTGRPVAEAARVPGKVVGSKVYVHHSALGDSMVPDALVAEAKALLPPDATYSVVRWDKQSDEVTFTSSPDWKEAHEPIVGDSWSVAKGAKEAVHRPFNEANPQIYHHKWAFVRDDYDGFDVEESKARSSAWERLNPDRSKIGYKRYWEAEVVPKLGEALDEQRPDPPRLTGPQLTIWQGLSPTAKRLLNTLAEFPDYQGQESTTAAKVELERAGLLKWLWGGGNPRQDRVAGWTRRGQSMLNRLRSGGWPSESLEEQRRKLIVFRVGSSNRLENRNAGNLAGVLHFLISQDEAGHGNKLTAFEVTMDGAFGEYERFSGGRIQSIAGKTDSHGQVGYTDHASGFAPGVKVKWYSFPAGGPWKARKLATVDLEQMARDSGWDDAVRYEGGDPDEMLTKHSRGWSPGTRMAMLEHGFPIQWYLASGWKNMKRAAERALRMRIAEARELEEKKSKKRRRAEQKASKAKAQVVQGGLPPAWQRTDPMTPGELKALEKMLDGLFASAGMDIEFTRHFFDRVNDRRNRRQITPEELSSIFREVFQRHATKIRAKGDDWEAVIADLGTDINVPFVLNWDRNRRVMELVAKTVMRKRGFKTPDKKVVVNTAEATVIPGRAEVVKG